MAGEKLQSDTLLFMGWFGPRGLTSIVFAVLIMGESLPGNHTLMAVVAWAIVLSHSRALKPNTHSPPDT